MTTKSRSTSHAGWRLLRARYQSRGIVLALGAGLAARCGLPNWAELLRRVGERCLPRHGGKHVDRLLAAGMTHPAIAGILESKCPRNLSFTDLLREQLYRDFRFRGPIKSPKERRDLVEFVNQKNLTMRAVAAMCAQREAPDGAFEANRRVSAVINFNVDSVFRAYARARYDAYLFRTIERADKPQRVGRIPIYHMHGLIKFDRGAKSADEEEIRCVFTEGEYYDVFNQPHSVFNYTFLYLLREYNCVFIGLSMNDENIRRLLHYSTLERRQQRQRGERASTRQTALRHFAILRRTTEPAVDELIDTSLRRLGTRVLWIDEYDELPSRLAFVYGEEHWPRVW